MWSLVRPPPRASTGAGVPRGSARAGAGGTDGARFAGLRPPEQRLAGGRGAAHPAAEDRPGRAARHHRVGHLVRVHPGRGPQPRGRVLDPFLAGLGQALLGRTARRGAGHAA